MVDFWFVVHDLMAYSQHGDMICCKESRNDSTRRRKPRQILFKKMKSGDKMVYYAAGSYAVVGIFEIVSDMEYFSDDRWKNVFVRKIRPFKMPPKNHYMHIKKLLFDSDYKFDIFPNKELWHTALRGKTVKHLSITDFDIFLRNIDNEKYLVNKKDTKVPVTVWQRDMGNRQSTF